LELRNDGFAGTDGSGSQGHICSRNKYVTKSPTVHRSTRLKRGGFLVSYPPFEALQKMGVEHLWDKPRFSLYIHLPYCRKRCTFCFYKVYTNRNAKPMDRYLDAVFSELDLYGERGELRDRTVNTIYLGGGTPTTLTAAELSELDARIRANFNVAPDVEYTCESEPGTLDARKLTTMREMGVTRLSMGVQSFDDELLKKNGRSHGVEQVYRTLKLAREQQFPVINLDLMSGIIDETPDTWERSLQALIDLEIEHVSIYRMEIYKNTLLYAGGYTGPGVGGIPTDEEELALWNRAVEKLSEAGYYQVTGHAFIKAPEHDHTQRADLWHGGEMLGVGVSSYSYMNGCLFQNSSHWDTYVERASNRKSAVDRWLRLNTHQRMARDVVLGFKCLSIDRAWFGERHGFDVLDLFGPQIEALVEDGLMKVDDLTISLTAAARPFVEQLCSIFFLEDYAHLRFNRFATEDELAQAEIMHVADLPSRPLHWAPALATAPTMSQG
jgi:oxygen-independent coproporphyrinogen-3 oxidase